MRNKERTKALQLEEQLQEFSKHTCLLKGICKTAERQAYVRQLLDSIRRVDYISVICNRNHSESRRDPNSDMFDPLKASVLFAQEGQLDDAFWMVFLYTHFSKNKESGWLLAREVYGGLGKKVWSWNEVSASTKRFCTWIEQNHTKFAGKFGNHRKYESLKPSSTHGTSAVVSSYVDWIGPSKSHELLIQKATDESDGDSHSMFSWLMHDMRNVLRFGRLARFDHLTMIGKLGLADISPGSPFLKNATGPLSGAKLLFNGVSNSSASSTSDLDAQVIQLGNYLGVGMQEMEDSICNWQKSPDCYEPFHG